MQKHLLILKLTFRSWWRNKLFAIISLISLAIGITCTNLLITFVVHEYTIESSNPFKEHILRLTQDIPYTQTKKQGYFVYGENVPKIVSGFPEIQTYLRMCEKEYPHVKVNEKDFPRQTIVCADSSFLQFFPFKTISGNLREALTKPGNIALSEELAHIYFGKEDPIGRNIEVISADKIITTRVSGVFKRHPQSMLQTNALTSLSPEDGASCMILLNKQANRESFIHQFEETELPTLTGKGHYRLQTLQDSYFDIKTSEIIHSIIHRQKLLPEIGLLSALLVLFIACFNYVNLSFSRLLKQMKMFHVENLMGATRKDIYYQLFTDTFLTVFIAFLLSILLTNDLLNFFNTIASAYLTFDFMFSLRVLPLILLFVFTLSLVPTLYIGYKMHSPAIDCYKQSFSGRKRQRIVSFLVVLQFIISIGLMFSFFIIRSQLQLVESEGNHYQKVMEIGGEQKGSVLPLYNDMKKLTGIQNITVSKDGIFGSWSVATPSKNQNGEEVLVSVYLYEETMNFLDFYDIHLLKPEQTRAMQHKTALPVVVNESFVRYLVPKGENPVGRPYNQYLKDDAVCNKGTITGVFKDFKVMSFSESSLPMRIILHDLPSNKASVIAFKLQDTNNDKTMTQIRQLWNKHFPDQPYTCKDIYSIYISRNQDVINFSRLFLAYSLLSLFLTILGLFGIAWFASEQRTREIGIRKVNGATTRQIILLLNRPFLVYILIAYTIAIPITYLLMIKWREQYIYKADIETGTFIIPLLVISIMAILTVSMNSWRSASANPINAIKE